MKRCLVCLFVLVAGCNAEAKRIEEAKEQQVAGELDRALTTLEELCAQAPTSPKTAQTKQLASTWLVEAADDGHIVRARQTPQRRIRAHGGAFLFKPGLFQIIFDVLRPDDRLDEDRVQALCLLLRWREDVGLLAAAGEIICVEQEFDAGEIHALMHKAARAKLLAGFDVGRQEDEARRPQAGREDGFQRFGWTVNQHSPRRGLYERSAIEEFVDGAARM